MEMSDQSVWPQCMLGVNEMKKKSTETPARAGNRIPRRNTRGVVKILRSPKNLADLASFKADCTTHNKS